MPDSIPADHAVATALDLIRASDAMDPAVISDAFEPEGILRFANGGEFRGPDRVRRSLASFFRTLNGVSHQVFAITTGRWDRGTIVSVEAEVSYTRADHTHVGPLPVTSIFRVTEEGQVARYQIYMDPSPLTATDTNRRHAKEAVA